jgi:hypothetical protein
MIPGAFLISTTAERGQDIRTHYTGSATPAHCVTVNGHEVLPSGGREISPHTVMSSAPLAAMRFPQSRELGWV